ncbi:unnamed protein product [Mucor hiemalis]
MIHTLTRDWALCKFYQLPYTFQGVKKAKEEFIDLQMDYEVCYLITPVLPRLVYKEMIRQNPTVFYEYPVDVVVQNQQDGEA